MEPCTFQPKIEKWKIHPEKISYTSGNEKPSEILTFQEAELSHISGKQCLEPWHNGTFLCFKKGIFRTLT